MTVAGLLAAACSAQEGGISPSASDVPASSAAVSVAATPAASAAPPKPPVGEPTAASAVDFVRYFWKTYNYAYASNDTGPLQGISAATCEFCTSAISDVRAVAAQEGHTTGGTVTVIDPVSPPTKVTTITLVTVSVSQQPGSLQVPLKPAKAQAGWKALRTDFAMGWDGSKWNVTGVEADTTDGQAWPG